MNLIKLMMLGDFKLTFIRGSKLRIGRENIVTRLEFQQLLTRAAEIEDEFFRLRASALLCVLRLTGKRRGEAATLKVSDVRVEGQFLKITFTLLKKRKETVLTKRATKSIPLTDPYTKPVLAYLEYLDTLKPKPEYFLPRVKSIFGVGRIIQMDAHISGRQVFNIVRGLTESVWPHLFRETAACDEIEKDPSIIGAFRVMNRLDLEDYRTGFNYLRRFAEHIIIRKGVLTRQEEYVIARE